MVIYKHKKQYNPRIEKSSPTNPSETAIELKREMMEISTKTLEAARRTSKTSTSWLS